jgi:two-component system response regulator DesR
LSAEEASSRRIRVIIAEDQAMVLGALAALLELEPDVSVVAQVRDGKQALAATLEHRPDVLITDIEMPNMTGLELAAALQAQGPATRVIILTTFARPGYLQRALEAGVRGYLLKESPSRELADAIRRVHAGEQVVNPRLAAEALIERDPLTDREREVLQLASNGASSGEIAGRLQLSKGTVRNHLSQAISKLSASNRVEAARIAKSKGWL